MPNHLTRHLTTEAQALAEDLAYHGPMQWQALHSRQQTALLELVAAGVAADDAPWSGWCSLTLAGATAHRAL